MIIACPACGTRYAVPDSAISGDGRTVRCAKCKHSWHQDPAPLDLTEPAPQAPPPSPAPSPVPSPSAAEERRPAPAPTPTPAPVASNEGEKTGEAPSINHWKTQEHPSEDLATRALRHGLAGKEEMKSPAVEEEPSAPAISEDVDPPSFDDVDDPLAGTGADAMPDYDDGYDDGEVSQFDYSPPITARRNPLKMWTAAAAIFAVLATGTVVAANYYGLPDWLPIERSTFGIGKPELELDFPASQQRTETLDNGEEIFRVRGAITNAGRESISIPSLLIVFKDERDRNVGDWIVVPSKSELAPGESLNVTEAIADIPASAKAAEIGWSPN
ncbi:MAG: zinc-ribbon domain-containing protein [Pseudomonadota bacterium]